MNEDNFLFYYALFFGGIIVLFICIRLFSARMDRGRIEQYCLSKGHELLERKWKPFGPGWYGSRGARIYQIVYRDVSGAINQAFVKTSLMSGIYLTGESELQQAPKLSVDDEIKQLKARLAELEALQNETNENGT